MSNYDILEKFNMKRTVINNERIREVIIKEMNKVDDLRSFYSENFIVFLKQIIIENVLTFEDIVNKIPSSNLIALDEYRYGLIKHIFGIEGGMPISYMMVKSLIEFGNLDYFDNQMYYLTKEDPISAPFTKEEFIKSVPMFKEKKKRYVYNF